MTPKSAKTIEKTNGFLMILEIWLSNEREALYMCVYLGMCMDMSVYVGMCLRAPGGRAGGQN